MLTGFVDADLMGLFGTLLLIILRLLMEHIGKPVSKSPDICTDAEIAEFMAFVLAGEEVTQHGLEARVRSAFKLGFLREMQCLVGIAALKCPSKEYRMRIESASGTQIESSKFPYEFGWAFILPSARGKRYSSLITSAVLADAGSDGVFATSRADNHFMHSTLRRLGFLSSGKSYPSNRGAHELQLFIREPRNDLFKSITLRDPT